MYSRRNIAHVPVFVLQNLVVNEILQVFGESTKWFRVWLPVIWFPRSWRLNLTWYTGAQRDESDGRDSVLQANGAAEHRSNVADDGSENADEDDRDHEADPA